MPAPAPQLPTPSDVAYELGAVVAAAKFAAEIPDASLREKFWGLVSPEHKELLAAYQEAGGQVNG